MTSLSDSELLRHYAREGSDQAFETLVRRHLDLVYVIAVRQVGGDAHLAKDVAQLVFTAVARKAAFLADRPVLGGWLCRTTQFVARDLVRAERRRRTREEQAEIMQSVDTPASTPDLPELRRQLDDALATLSERDRDAVWLRFFGQQSFAQIGSRLRLSENTARMRVERALEKIRLHLSKRGITSTALALGELLSEQAAGSAPATLAAVICGSISAGPAAAFFSLLHFMTSSQLAAIIAGGLAAAATIGLFTQRNVNAQLRSENAALHQEAAESAAARIQNRKLEQSLQEADRELSTLLGAVDRARTSAPKAAVPPATPPQPQSVMFIGQIRYPGMVPITAEGGLPLTQALALAGGFTEIADRRIVINHRQPDGTITQETVDLRQIEQGQIPEPKLSPTDFVFVAGRTK